MSTHTGTFKTRHEMHMRFAVFGGLCVIMGIVGGYVGAQKEIMITAIYGGFGLMSVAGGYNTFGKIMHDKNGGAKSP